MRFDEERVSDWHFPVCKKVEFWLSGQLGSNGMCPNYRTDVIYA